MLSGEWQVLSLPLPDMRDLAPVDPEQFKAVVSKPIPPEWIRRKDVGHGLMRPYIPGARVRQLVDEATGGRYVWEILAFSYRKANDRIERLRYSPRTSEGEPASKGARAIPQPHYVVVFGRLSIPGIGSRAGVGVDVLWDTEDVLGQANAFKAAATDAFKVAAAGFGFGRDLYLSEDDVEESAVPADGATRGSEAPAQGRPQVAHTQVASTQGARRTQAGNWLPLTNQQAARLGDLKRQLRIQTADQLVTYITEWGQASGTGAKSFRDLNATNADSFLEFLQRKLSA